MVNDWHPEALTTIADRLGIAFTDLAPPRSARFRTHGGPTIHVLDWGGQGPPAVLLHGGALTARTWDSVAIALRSDFRLIALDMRGHGASDWADDYSIESCAADLLAVIDGLGIERARIVGMSLGGMVACEFALRHRDRTESLVMVDVTSRPVFAATARMRTFMTDFPGAATVDEVVEMALAVSPRSDPERLYYRMRTLLKRDDDGRLVWKSDRRRPADYPMILRHLAGFEAAFRTWPRRSCWPGVVKASSSRRMPLRTSPRAFPTGGGSTSRARATTFRKIIRAIWPTR